MSTVVSKNVQIGADGTASNNFTAYQPSTPDGTLRIGNGNSGSVTDAIVLNSSGVVSFTNNPTLSGGTANGVAYLNGSKVLTSGSALTFNGTNLGVGGTTTTIGFTMTGAVARYNNDNFYMQLERSGTAFAYIGTGSNTAGGAVTDLGIRAENNMVFAAGATEKMRLTSTSLYTASGINVGIGTSSPSNPLTVQKANGGDFVALFQNTTSATPYGVFIKDAASSANGYPLLQVTNSAGSVAYLRVDSGTGNVGIGTGSPVAKLAVVGGTSNASDLATAYSLAAFNITPKITSGYSLAFGSGPGDKPYIQMSAGGTAPNSLLIQPYGGNVGIGVEPTNAKLEVVATSGEVFRADSSGGAYRIVAHQTGVSMQGTVSVAGTVSIGGNGSGLDFDVATNQRISFNSNRALEGSSDGATLQVGEGYTKVLTQGHPVFKHPTTNHYNFIISKTFTATGSSVTKHAINLNTEIGASTAGVLGYTVHVVGYGSGGSNGCNYKYTVGGYSGHDYSAQNHNSYGAGTIENGYDSAVNTEYDARGIQYHPCKNLGAYIANGEIYAYVPGAQQYGVAISNNHSASFSVMITVSGTYTA
jgi:hypothetical protein